MKNLLRIGMLLCSFLLASVGWAMAQEGNTGNTIYVNAGTGDDTNGGTTSDKAVKTLAKALEKATSGGDIQLAAGTYNETSALTISKAVTIKGAVGGEKPTISGQTITVSAADGAEVKFENLTLTPNDNNNHAVIVSSNAKVFLTNCSLDKCNNGVRMTGTSAELTLDNTDIDCSFYAISVRNINQKVTVSGGTLTGWAAIMTSANEITSTDNSGTSINVSGATLVGRAILNGFSQDYGTVVLQENYNGVTATFTDCTVSTTAIDGKNATQMSGLFIRSYANKVTFTGGSISALVAQNCQSDGTQESTKYLHAALISLGHRDDPENSALKANTITISTTMNHVDGQFDVFSYRQGDNKKKDELTINGTAYSYTAGNILYGSATADCSPQSRINNAIDGEKIVLAAATYLLSSQLVINKAITLEGAGIGKTYFKPGSNWNSSVPDPQQSLVSIENKNSNETGDVIIRGIELQNSKGNGINVQTSRNTTIENVRIYKSAKYGLVVHSSVSASSLITSSNSWGSVNVDEGDPLYPNIKFTFDNATTTFEEQLMIFDETTAMNAVEGPDQGWVSKIITGEKSGKAWTYALVTSTGSKTNRIVYANGYPITIEQDPNGTYVRVYRTDYPKNFFQGSSKTIVYGGSLNADVENTSITMKSGKVAYLYGGGETSTDSETTANVTGKASIKIEGGTIKDYLVGGGNQKSKVNEAEIVVTGAETKIAWIYAGGFASPAQLSLPYTWENTVCGVKNLTINITDATITGGLGCGGGQGYCYTGTSTINTNNANIKYIYGTVTNGYANEIHATFNGGSVTGFTTMNRGQVGEATYTFNNCAFPEPMTTVAYMGATRGWANSDWNAGSPMAQVNSSVTYSFNGCTNTPYVYLTDGITNANVTLNGTKAIIDKFNRGNCYPEEGREVTAYAINESNTWNLNNGLEVASDVTLTQTGTLVVNGTMKVATAEQAAQAILKGNAAVIDASSLTADAVLTKMNSVEDKVLQLKAMQIKTSDNAYIFTDNEMALNYLANHAKVLALVDGTYQLNEAKQIGIQLITNDEQNPLTASDVEAGKCLATSVLKGGFAQTTGENPVIVVGSFAWSNPDTEVSADGSHKVVFTPLDIRYATATANVSVKAIKYYTIVTGTSANGTVTITNANAANKYTTGTVLNLSYTPDTHYEVAADQPSTFTVGTDNATITGEFKIKQHKVNIASVTNGSVIVKSGSTAITDGTLVDEGTLLNITASPTGGYTLASLTNNGVAIRNNALVVDAAVSLAATFSRLLQTNATVTVSTMENGKLLLLDQSGNSINKGASVAKNSTLTVIAIPNEGYVLSGNITATGATYIEDTKVWTVDDNAVFSASFVQEEFDLVVSSNGAIIEAKKGETTVTKAKVGETLTLTATISDNDKKVASLIVDGKEIANGGSFVVSGKPIIVANVVEKAKIGFNDLTQTVVYDGTQKQFIVRSIPAGLTGFTVTYNETPINAANHDKKEYTVTISREADDTYQAVNETGKLIIEAAPSKGFKAPTWDGSQWNNGADGTFTDNDQGEGFRNVIFTPNDGNFKSVQFSVAKSTTGLTPILLTNSGLRATAAALTITGRNHGYVTLWNGTEQITSTSSIYPGQTLTVKAMPDAGYSSLATWKINGVAVANPCNETSITLVDDANTIDVAFRSKITPTLPSLSSTAAYTYSGSAIYPIIENTSGLTGWNVLVKSGDLVIDEPTVAGTYQVYVTRDEDEMYASVDGTTAIGSYTIQPRVITAAELTSLTATSIIWGQTLASSTISGTAPVAGNFSWNTPSMVAEKSTEDQGKSVAYPISFIPADVHNYKVADGVSLTLSVPFYTVGASAPEIAVRHITFAPAANGTFVVKVNGVAVETGAQVSTGDQVVVETTPNSGYSASVSYTGITNGVVDASGDVAVTVTFTQNSAPVTPGGGGTVDPAPEIPTVSNPVVAERTATTAAITWEKVSGATSYKLFLYAKKTDSTPLKTYEFDKDGKLKATTISFTLTGLKEGKSYYIETAAYNALGTLLVKKSVELSATPTGIEAISEGSQLYTVRGAIVVAPAEPLQVAIYSVTGQTLFNDEVSYLTQVPAQAGIYVVVIQKGKERITEKVFVK